MKLNKMQKLILFAIGIALVMIILNIITMNLNATLASAGFLFAELSMLNREQAWRLSTGKENP